MTLVAANKPDSFYLNPIARSFADPAQAPPSCWRKPEQGCIRHQHYIAAQRFSIGYENHGLRYNEALCFEYESLR